MLAAGILDQRVTLQTATVTRDTVGGVVETWADTVTVWASVRPLTAKQIAQAQQVSADVRKAVTIRWRSGVSAAMRLKFSDSTTAKVQLRPVDGKSDCLILDYIPADARNVTAAGRGRCRTPRSASCIGSTLLIRQQRSGSRS